MRTIIIPDVHHKTALADAILDKTPHDNVVWLGDFFDDFDDTPEIAARTATWLRNRMDRWTEDIYLLGNHDAPYMWPGIDGLLCSGFHPLKAREIRQIMPPEDYRERFKLIIQISEEGRCSLFPHPGEHEETPEKSWVITHAGLHPMFDVCEVSVAYKLLSTGDLHPLLRAGRARGGSQIAGGLTWLDWNHEFKAIPGMNQLVGHTPGPAPREHSKVGAPDRRSRNYCIDTHLRHFAVIEDGDLTIQETTPAMLDQWVRSV